MSANNSAIVIGVTAIDNARNVLTGVDNKIKQTADDVDTQGQRMATRTSLLAAKFKENFRDIATSATGLAVGLTSFVTSFSDLDKAQASVQSQTVALARAQDTLQSSTTSAQSAQNAYSKALERYNNLANSGKASANELAIAHADLEVKSQKLADAQDKLKTNQQNVELATTKLNLAQGDLSDAYTNFLVQIPQQVLGFGLSAIGIFNMLGVSQKTNSATTLASAITYNGALASMNTANELTEASTLSLGAVMKSVFLSNPITLPLIAISALIMAIALNVGGLRDRINELGKAIGDAIPFLRPLLEAIGSLQHLFGGSANSATELAKATDDLARAQDAAKASTDDFTTATNLASDSIDAVTKHVATLNDYLQDQTSNLAETYHNNLLYVESTGKIKDALALSNEELNNAAEFLRTQQRETETAKQNNFNLVASVQGLDKALSMTDEQLQTVADSLRKQKQAAEDAASAYDKMKSSAETAKTALEALAEAQQRQVITQFGQQVGLSGTVSTAALQAAGFGGNADLMQSAASGRLGGVFVAGKGRVLDTGGTLYEDVLGFGTRTGTPHLLHAGEDVIPRNKSSGNGRGQPATIIFEVDGEAIARATIDDITKLQGKQTRLQAKTFRQRVL